MTTSQVIDLTKSLSNNELKLLSLGPKFIMTQKLYDNYYLILKPISAKQFTN